MFISLAAVVPLSLLTGWICIIGTRDSFYFVQTRSFEQLHSLGVLHFLKIMAKADETVKTVKKENEAVKKVKVKRQTWKRWWQVNVVGSVQYLCEPDRTQHSYDAQKIYWDCDGNLRQGLSDRRREEEMLKILENDTVEDESPDKVWYIIPSRWVRNWLIFAHLKLSENAPGPIDLSTLIKDDEKNPGWYRPKKTLQPPSKRRVEGGDFAKQEYEIKPGHFRRIGYDTWKSLISLYGIEEPKFTICVLGNTKDSSADDTSRWVIFSGGDPLKIDKSILPEPIIEDKAAVEEQARRKRKMFENMGFS